MSSALKFENKNNDFNLFQRFLIGLFVTIGVLLLFSGCSALYNTVYTVQAKQIIRGKSYLTGYEEHVISDADGKVYRIFQAPASKKDSTYHVVKRMSYGRERSIRFYYKKVKPKKLKNGYN